MLLTAFYLIGNPTEWHSMVDAPVDWHSAGSGSVGQGKRTETRFSPILVTGRHLIDETGISHSAPSH